jgi:ribonuclease VapC
MTKAVIDASALLRFIDGESGCDRVEETLNEARLGSVELLISAVNWGEVVYAVLRAHGSDEAQKLVPRLRALPFSIAGADAEHAELAAAFKHAHKVPYADSFAGSLALSQDATLLTADHDFKTIPSKIVKIDFLPVKSKS